MGVIGKYETHEQIGAGTMGIVYRARDMVLDRYVALKVLRMELDSNSEVKERFYREAKAGARLQHPNIAIIYDLDEANNRPYIAMELLEGGDFKAYIEQGRHLSLAQKLEFLAQACDGLAHAHRHGFVHRDIKPSNIFIHEERQAKVLDFGIARLPSSTLTLAGVELGTPNYMAPEQILSRPCDARSDIFSAGIVFFEFLVNVHPFKSSFTPLRIAEEAPDSLYDHDAHIPPALDTLLERALSKRPEDRVQTAREFGTELRRILEVLRSGMASSRIPTGGSFAANEVGTPIPPVPAHTDCDDHSRGAGVYDFIQLVKEFEIAMADGKLPVAAHAVERMRKMAVENSVFVDPLREHEERLAIASTTSSNVEAMQMRGAIAGSPMIRGYGAEKQDANAVPRTNQPVIASNGQEKAPDSRATHLVEGSEDRKFAYSSTARRDRVCARCRQSNDPTAKVCSTCGGTLESKALLYRRALVYAVVKPLKQREQWQNAFRAIVSRFQIWLRKGLHSWLRWALFHRRIFTAALVCLFIIIAVSTWLSFPRQILVQESVGRAMVQVSNADILSDPVVKGRRIASLQGGTWVNIIKRPGTDGPRWVAVQYVSSDGTRSSESGYMLTTDLGNWTTTDRETAWAFLWLSHPADSASETEIEQFATRLENLSGKFPALLSKADLQRARLYALLLSRSKDGGKPASDRARILEQAKSALGALPANLDPEQINERDTLQKQVNSFVASDAASGSNLPPSASEAPIKPADEIATLLGQIPVLWETGRYRKALSSANRVLELDPGNTAAQQWSARIRESVEAEKKYSN
ncbi:MAG: serine/threonine-protein kinase [Bryobacteraceae bacterium]